MNIIGKASLLARVHVLYVCRGQEMSLNNMEEL